MRGYRRVWDKPGTSISFRISIIDMAEFGGSFMSDGSSIPYRQLGRLLREAREAAGISMAAASKSLQWSTAKMYRVEAGTAPLRTPDITTMCTLYEVAPEMQDLLIKLAKEGREGAWWHAYGDTLPPWFELF